MGGGFQLKTFFIICRYRFSSGNSNILAKIVEVQNIISIRNIGKCEGSLYVFSLDCWEIAFEHITDLLWLGSGAQGAVFRGKYKGYEVAVKKVRNYQETEIRHLRRLNHPNIIKFK